MNEQSIDERIGHPEYHVCIFKIIFAKIYVNV